MLRIEDIIAIEFPIVWTSHDMRTFTGGCHYDEHWGRYKEKFRKKIKLIMCEKSYI